MDNKSILKSNFLILFSNLENSIIEYLKHGHSTGEMQYIDAYLAATIHALVDYADKYLDKDDEKIQACRYANNTLKHNGELISHKKSTGGFSFPFSSPFVMEEINIIWSYDISIKVRHPEQQKAFEKHFAGKPILDTLRPIMRQIEED